MPGPHQHPLGEAAQQADEAGPARHRSAKCRLTIGSNRCGQGQARQQRASAWAGRARTTASSAAQRHLRSANASRGPSALDAGGAAGACRRPGDAAARAESQRRLDEVRPEAAPRDEQPRGARAERGGAAPARAGATTPPRPACSARPASAARSGARLKAPAPDHRRDRPVRQGRRSRSRRRAAEPEARRPAAPAEPRQGDRPTRCARRSRDRRPAARRAPARPSAARADGVEEAQRRAVGAEQDVGAVVVGTGPGLDRAAAAAGLRRASWSRPARPARAAARAAARPAIAGADDVDAPVTRSPQGHARRGELLAPGRGAARGRPGLPARALEPPSSGR